MTITAEILGQIRSIPRLYAREQFAETLAIYNLYNRFFELEEFESYQTLIAESKYCVGTILLWDLTEINQHAALIIPNSWLDRRMGSLKDQRLAGLALLQEVTRQDELPQELYEKTYRVLRKIYQR